MKIASFTIHGSELPYPPPREKEVATFDLFGRMFNAVLLEASMVDSGQVRIRAVVEDEDGDWIESLDANAG